MKTMGILIAAGLLLASAPPATTVADLGWMSGTWVSETSEEWTEEQWTTPRGGVMMATIRFGRGEKARGFEFLRVAEDAEGIVTYWASPSGRPATPFRLISAGPGEVVFENPAHDYPTRISYRRQGETFIAMISGPEGKNTQSWTFRKAD